MRHRILVGDVMARLADIPDDSVDLVVTSPPYWNLRDYDVVGQMGMEATMAEHIAALVTVFDEIRRVLKTHGSCFVNYGDCYATTPNGRSAADGKAMSSDDRTFRDKPGSTIGGGIKPKDLCMLPNRIAIALQDDGWWIRSEIVWGKTNSMPDSSGSQRPSTAHEKIFWIAKSNDAPIYRARDTGELSFTPDLKERCALITDPDRDAARWIKIGTYYDANAVLQGRAGDEDANGFRGGSYVNNDPGPRKVKGNKRVKMPDRRDTGEGTHGSHHRLGREKGMTRADSPRHEGHINHTGIANTPRGEGRFLRNYEPASLPVWEMAIEPFKEAHFATFPQELARRCIGAGCPIGGMVLDPFGGSGTTALVAEYLQRNSIIIELNPKYAQMAHDRIYRSSGLLAEITLEIAE